jgi:4a-hydroxytetrahydrobiopterin dehydratase
MMDSADREGTMDELPGTSAELATHVCEHRTSALSAGDAGALQQLVSEWAIEGDRLVREFRFSDYHGTIGFVNAVAWIANRQDHHPDLAVGYNRCRVELSTHSAGGLTLNDFICAARIDQLVD